MDLGTMDFGSMIWQMGMVDSFMLMEMCMKDIGWMIKQTVKEHIVILMEQRMKVIGLTISNMGKATKSGLMDLNMLENM